MIYRKAELSDLDLLREMRKTQLEDEGATPVDIDLQLNEYIGRRLGDGSMVQWIAVDEATGEAAGTGAVVFMDFPPSFTNPIGTRAYIASMFTNRTYRRQGIALEILGRLMEECKARGVKKVILSASDMGRPVYLKFGFQPGDMWMIMDL